jgi:hypothetical protein
MRPGTAVRSDRFSAGVARLLILSGVLLAALGLAALVLHTAFPLFGWAAWAPDVLALSVLAAARIVPPRPLFRPFGG